MRGRRSSRHLARKTHYRPAVERVEARALLATFAVTTTADAGAGSLRQAILDANSAPGDDLIAFNIGSGGRQTITPTAPLPTITDTVRIDATTQPGFAGTPLIEINGSSIFFPGPNPPNTVRIPNVNGLTLSTGGGTIRGLVINRFTGSGIALIGGGSNLIAGNYLGTDVAGVLPLGNGRDGLTVTDSRNNVIGGANPADRNIISGNTGNGIDLGSDTFGSVLGGNRVLGNLIGADINGNNLGNGFAGVVVTTSGNSIGAIAPGAGNTIAYNGGSGVLLGGSSTPFGQELSNTVLSNSIFSNNLQGIQLSFGAADTVFDAVLNSAFPTPGGGGTTVEGSFFGTPNAPYTLQFFSNLAADPSGRGEGRTLIGTTVVSTDANGLADFQVDLPTATALNQVISATATDASTSAFFRNARVTASASTDLAVQQFASPDPVLSGNRLTYTIFVGNVGPSTATGTVLTGELPAGAVLVEAESTQGTVTRVGDTISVDVGTLPRGEFATVTVVVVPRSGVTASTTFEVRSDQIDPTPGNNTSTLDIPIVPDVVPPRVAEQRLTVGLRSIDGIVLTFSKPLDPLQAQNPINYSLQLIPRETQPSRGRLPRSLGRGSRDIDVAREIDVDLNPPVYDEAAQTVTLIPTKPLQLGQVYRLTINGLNSAGVTDLAGNLLDGDANGTSGGPFVSEVSRGAPPPSPTPTPTPRGPRPRFRVGGPPQVKLVESLVGRRVLVGPPSVLPLAGATSFENEFSTRR